jgi:PAS domain S-box-containing protein
MEIMEIDRPFQEPRAWHLLDTLPVGLVFIGSDGVIAGVTRRATEILGISPDEVVGRRYDEPNWGVADRGGNDLDAMVLSCARTLETGEPAVGHCHGVRGENGRTRVLRVDSAPSEDGSGVAGAVVAVVTDVSSDFRAAALRRMERDLLATIEEVDTLDEVFSSVTAAIRSIEEVASTAVFLRDEESGAFLLQAESGMDPAALPILRRIPAAPGLPDAFLHGERSMTTSLRALFAQLFPQGYSGPSQDAILDAPVIVIALEHDERIVGGLSVRLHPGEAVREDLRVFLDALGVWLAGVIHRRSVQAALRRATEQLTHQEAALNAANTALRVLLDATRDQAETDRRRMQESVIRVVKPFITRVKAEIPDRSLARAAELVEINLASLSGSIAPEKTDQKDGLTPREQRIAAMVRDGLSGKEIAAGLGVSVHAVAFHRRNIRRKLGITGKRANLATVLAYR